MVVSLAVTSLIATVYPGGRGQYLGSSVREWRTSEVVVDEDLLAAAAGLSLLSGWLPNVISVGGTLPSFDEDEAATANEASLALIFPPAEDDLCCCLSAPSSEDV